jgi:acyl-coenzyme A thioesterase PaaI-like protein
MVRNEGAERDLQVSGETTRKSWPFVEAANMPATGVWAEKRRLASAMRQVIDHLVSVDAPAEALRETAIALEEFAGSLTGLPRTSRLQGYAEAANSGDVYAVFDQSPLIGLSNPLSPPIRLKAVEGRVTGNVVFGSAFEGPPTCVHGGFVAAAFDEVLGFAQCEVGTPGMTGQLTVRYLKPTPLHQNLTFDAGVDRIENRKIFASGKLFAGETLTAEASAIFITITQDTFEQFLGDSAGGKTQGQR